MGQPDDMFADEDYPAYTMGRARWSNRWKAALNALDITFDGRVSAGRL
jgi:hypothetical protein